MPLSNPQNTNNLNLDVLRWKCNEKLRGYITQAINSSGLFTSILSGKGDTLYHYCKAETVQGVLTSRNDEVDPCALLDIMLNQGLDEDGKRDACRENMRKTVHKGTVRATSMAYLNDKEEYVHGESYFINEVTTSTNPFISGLKTDFVVKFDNAVERTQRLLKTHVFCLSFRKDSLSQWRAYGDNGSGYSIGFDRFKTNLDPGEEYTMKPVGFDLSSGGSFPVVYENTKKADFVKIVLEATGDFFIKEAPADGFDSTNPSHIAIALELISILVAVYSPIMKHDAFIEEDEYRIVLNSQYGQYDHIISTFPSNGLMKPYIELHAIHQEMILPSGGSGTIQRKVEPLLLPITEIIIGPCLESERAKYGMEILLANKGYTGVAVRPSGIPYLP